MTTAVDARRSLSTSHTKPNKKVENVPPMLAVFHKCQHCGQGIALKEEIAELFLEN